MVARRLTAKQGINHRRALVAKARSMSDVISLGRGDPDLATPAHIVQATKDALDQGKTGYMPWGWDTGLREAVAEKLSRDNRIEARAEEVLITVGAEEAVFITMMAILDPGDEILVPGPRYTPYDMAVEMAGGVVVSVPTTLESEFQIELNELEKRVTPKSKALLLITPNNPTGQIMDPDRVRVICDFAQEHGLMVISDELYEAIVFDGAKTVSAASLPGMKERTITINGFSKAYCMTGWRVGYLHAPQQFINAMIPLKYTMTICAASMCQMGALAALKGPQHCIAEFCEIYSKRREVVLQGLRTADLKFGPPRGTFYVFVEVGSLGISSIEFCQKLLSDKKVLVFPGDAFGDEGEGFVRISLLAPMEEVYEAIDRIVNFVNRLSK
jgi:aminotransferase